VIESLVRLPEQEKEERPIVLDSDDEDSSSDDSGDDIMPVKKDARSVRPPLHAKGAERALLG